MEKLLTQINNEFKRNATLPELRAFLKILGYDGINMSNAQIDVIRTILHDWNRVFKGDKLR